MSSRASNILLLPVLLATIVAGAHTATAAVMSVGASFEVSAQVVASCSIETGGLHKAVNCGGGAAVTELPAAALNNPTVEEAAATSGTRVLLVTY